MFREVGEVEEKPVKNKLVRRFLIMLPDADFAFSVRCSTN
jgi:hypothetical protein